MVFLVRGRGAEISEKKNKKQKNKKLYFAQKT